MTDSQIEKVTKASVGGIKKSNCAAGRSEKAKSGLVPFCRAIARKKAPVGSLDLLKFDCEETFGEMMWAAVHARLVWVHTGGEKVLKIETLEKHKPLVVNRGQF